MLMLLRSRRPRRFALLTGLALPLLLHGWGGTAVAEPPAPVPAVAPAAAPVYGLADCIAIALDRQPALAAARSSLAAAQAQQRSLDNLHAGAALLARDLPIRRKQACLGVTILQAGLQQAEWDTVYAVTRTYYSVIYAREQVRVADELVANLRGYRDTVSKAVKAGTSREWTKNTEDKISVYVSLAEARQAEAARGIDRALAALKEAMGLAVDCPLEIADQRLPYEQRELCREQVLELALRLRGEMVQAATVSEVIRLEVDAQGKTHLPTARTFAAFVDIHARPIPQGESDGEYRPGAVGIEMPTTLAGRRGDRVERAQAFSARAGAVVDKTRNLILLETEDLFLKWREGAGRIAQSAQGAEAGTRLAKATAADFRNNVAKIEDVLTNEALAAQARAAYNEALYQRVLALAGLERVTAGGIRTGFIAPAPAQP